MSKSEKPKSSLSFFLSGQSVCLQQTTLELDTLCGLEADEPFYVIQSLLLDLPTTLFFFGSKIRHKYRFESGY